MSRPPFRQTKRVTFHLDTYAPISTEPMVRGAWCEAAELTASAGWKLDPVNVPDRTPDDVDLFRQITEGRGGDKGYSSCVDLAFWVAARMGVRDERFLNRDDDNLDGIPDVKQRPTDEGQPGAQKWITSVNVAKFKSGAIALGAWVNVTPGARPVRGTPLLVGDNGAAGMEHVLMVVSDPNVRPDGSYYIDTVEAGQVGKFGEQCCRSYKARFVEVRADGSQWMSGRKVQGWVDVMRLPYATDALVPLDSPYGWSP